MDTSANNKGIDAGDAVTVIGKAYISLAHIEYKADSIQTDGIFNMLLAEKKRIDQAENTIAKLAKPDSDYTKIKGKIRIYKIRYESLINAVYNLYYTDIGFCITNVSSYEEVVFYRDLALSRRKILILEKYKKLALDYVNDNYSAIHP